MDSSTRPRHARIGGADIWVFDGLLDSVATLVHALNRAPFTRTEVATPETANFLHWACEMDLRTLAQLPIYQATQRAVQSVMSTRNYRPYRAYTNFASHGDVLLIHTDCAPGADEYTALWYLAKEWDADWVARPYSSTISVTHSLSSALDLAVLFSSTAQSRMPADRPAVIATCRATASQSSWNRQNSPCQLLVRCPFSHLALRCTRQGYI